MNVEQARACLQGAIGEEEPISLPMRLLSELTRNDVPEGVSIEVGTMKDRCLHLDWNGRLCREGNFIFGEADHTWTRK